MVVWCGSVDYGDVFTNCINSLHSDMSHDPMDSLSSHHSSVQGDEATMFQDFKFGTDDVPLHGAVPAMQPASTTFTLPDIYGAIPERSAFTQTSLPSSPASNTTLHAHHITYSLFKPVRVNRV